MDRRENTRIAAAHVIPVQVKGLGSLRLRTSGRILDISSNGLRISMPEAVPVGSFLQLQFEDATIFAEARYCLKHKNGYTIGVFVEEILLGTSELARLVASLVADSPDRMANEPLRVG